ncbi:MAG: hypothetical protein KGL73_07315 [Burkholderiales bacterium]|nr:hypothetical protein [Burkholderiales bacterium]
MTKWLGYSTDSGRVRFQRRIPEDVQHAFNGDEWIRFPLNLPPGREAQRRALAWYVVYEEEFARVRHETEGGQSASRVGVEAKSLNDYRATLTKFLNRARRDYGDQGFPVLSADYEYTGNQRGARDKQRHLEEAELVRLFEGAEFAAIAADPAQAHHYWLPVIGLYTGARPREICQLNPQCDWGEAAGVAFFIFDENTPAGVGVVKSIKTGEKRLVPMHPELVRLGLPEFLAGLRDAGADGQ